MARYVTYYGGIYQSEIRKLESFQSLALFNFYCKYFQENDLGLHKHRSTLRIDMDPPHLVLLDDDPLNTSITIFSLNVSSSSQHFATI